MTNEDLIRAHILAVWLACIEQALGSSLREVLGISGDKPALELVQVPDLLEEGALVKIKAMAVL